MVIEWGFLRNYIGNGTSRDLFISLGISGDFMETAYRNGFRPSVIDLKNHQQLRSSSDVNVGL